MPKYVESADVELYLHQFEAIRQANDWTNGAALLHVKFFRLPHFDPIKDYTIDPIHLLYFGIAKKTTALSYIRLTKQK